MRWLIGIILGEIICKSSNWQHIQRLKITILGENRQLFRLERIAKCSYFILSTQNIKFYWFIMKIKKFMLPIWWYNRGLFPLGNKYFWVFVLYGLKALSLWYVAWMWKESLQFKISSQIWLSRYLQMRMALISSNLKSYCKNKEVTCVLSVLMFLIWLFCKFIVSQETAYHMKQLITWVHCLLCNVLSLLCR